MNVEGKEEGGRRREEHWADGMMIGSNSGFSKSAEKRGVLQKIDIVLCGLRS